MSGKRTVWKTCTKEHPFIPPLKDDEIWDHIDAYEKNTEHESRIVIVHCPNCGIDINMDLAD